MIIVECTSPQSSEKCFVALPFLSTEPFLSTNCRNCSSPRGVQHMTAHIGKMDHVFSKFRYLDLMSLERWEIKSGQTRISEQGSWIQTPITLIIFLQGARNFIRLSSSRSIEASGPANQHLLARSPSASSFFTPLLGVSP